MKINIGVSSCLFGVECRYNGVAAKDNFILNELNKHVNITNYCPEAIFGVPREPIRLVNIANEIKVITSETKQDLTTKLISSSKNLAQQAQHDNLSGFIFKSKSPSCGMEKVKIYYDDVRCEKTEVGVFVRELRKVYPQIPIEEEGRLNDAWLRENFISSIFAYNDVNNLLKKANSINTLIEFHTKYKYFLLAKSPELQRALGVIVANNKQDLDRILFEYRDLFIQALVIRNTINGFYNVLLHIFGYFKKFLNKAEKQELLKIMQDFKDKIIPLIAVVKVMQIYINKFNIDYLMGQKFLDPYPEELALRSTISAYR